MDSHHALHGSPSRRARLRARVVASQHHARPFRQPLHSPLEGAAACSLSSAIAYAEAAHTNPTQNNLRQELHEARSVRSTSRGMLSRVAFQTGNRCSVSTTIPANATLPALLPLLRAFPDISWSADAQESAAGDSLTLRDHKSQSTPLVSVFVHDDITELEILGPPNGTARCDRAEGSRGGADGECTRGE